MRTEITLDENGQPVVNYITETTHHVLVTGAVTGAVKLSDGTVYDLTPPFIELEDEAHEQELHAHIERWHDRNSTFVDPNWRETRQDAETSSVNSQ
jgi:hypothetical protein